MGQSVRVGIAGASGYGGGELIRLLAAAPGVELTLLASSTYAGQPVHSSFPGVRADLPKFEPWSEEQAIARCDAVFLAQENGRAMVQARPLLDAGKKVVDLAADFRLRDPALYPEWYGFEHASADLLAEAVYGLPEMFRDEIRGARLVANPGCYPTATTLAILPLLENRLIDPDSLVVDAKSGVSGAGRSKFGLDYHFSEVNESVRAYGVGGKHRHTPEIEQQLSAAAGRPVRITFTPHLIPITRGILSTCVAALTRDVGVEDLVEVYRHRYAGHPFVSVLQAGQTPATKGTYGTNQCHIGLAVDRRTNRVLAFGAIDNLVKGAAGQAVQNLNLMWGLAETNGLEGSGVWP